MQGSSFPVDLWAGEGGAKAIRAYDAASDCLTSAYKQHKNNYYILKF